MFQFRNCVYKVSSGLLGTFIGLNNAEGPLRNFLGKPFLILVVIVFSTFLKKKWGGINFSKVQQAGLSLVMECRIAGNPLRINTATECNGRCKQCAGCPHSSSSLLFFCAAIHVFCFEKELYR